MYVVVAGGGIAGSTVARELLDHRHDVLIIDNDRQICEELYAHSGIITIHGDARDIEILREAKIDKADVALATMYLDADNLTFALLAHSCGVSRIIVKMRDPAYTEAFKMAGATSICDMSSMFKHKVIIELESPKIKVIMSIEHDKAQLIMFELPMNWPHAGITIKELALKKPFLKHCVFAGLIDQDVESMVVPRGNDQLYPGNKVFMVARSRQILAIEKYLEGFDKIKGKM
ncbi:MAG: TrkA family potassium uptake protein [Thermodesulfobacteriota bacterium]|nr:TrkA family potassium uptake protein [Thermodesulfobacteriota bacterium]